MSYIHVWPDRFPDRWDGGEQVSTLTAFPRVPLREALEKRYNTDAHFSPALLGEYTVFPPMKKKGFPKEYQDLVRYQVVAIDLDAPDEEVDGKLIRHHRTPEWETRQLELLRGSPWDGAIKYVTMGGYRLVWELPETLGISQYESVARALGAALTALGLKPDPLFDWPRCFRLPFVLRRDERTNFKPVRQELPYYDSDNPVLPVALLDLVPGVDLSTAPVRLGAEVADTKLPLSLDSSAVSGRNNFLYRIACSLRNLAWIDEELMAEMLDRVNQRKFSEDPLDFTECQELASKVFGQHQPQDGTDLQTITEEPLPQIQLRGGELDVHVREAIASLGTADNLYTRNGKLVRLTSEQIETLPKAALRTLMCESAEYIRAKPRKDGGFDEVRVDPPKELVDCVYEAGIFPGLRELEQIIPFATLRPDGSFIVNSGYDETTRSYLRHNTPVQIQIPEIVTREMAMDSLARVQVVFQDFPFAEEAHKASALAAIMTPVLRLAITGPTPLFIFTSTTPGSGKSLLADIVSNIAIGADASRRPQTDDTEMRKEITSDLLAGTPVILIDNVDRPLGGPALDAALTSIWWTGRELGRTGMLKLKNITTWLATGNNVMVRGDLARRALLIALDPNMERPEERKGFQIPKLLEYVRLNRAQLIQDILILARGRHQDRDFMSDGGAFGSFESWAYWVRDTVMWCGMEDPLSTQKPLREGSQVSTWGQVLYNLFECFNSKKSRIHSDEFTAKQMWDVVYDGAGAGPAENKTALSAGYQELTDDNSIRKTGYILNLWKNRVVGGYKLVMNTERRLTRGATFRVERTDVPNLHAIPKIG